MYETLHNCGRLQVRPSKVEGYGVFATAPIKKGEVLEEVPFILFPHHTALGKNLQDLLTQTGFLSDKEKFIETLRQTLKFKAPELYYFKWFAPVPVNGETVVFTVLPLGFGPIYNSSNTNNNAGWFVKEKTFLFRAERDIETDEEIFTFFGYFLAENGGIFNCHQVFNLAIDKDEIENRNKVKSIRFGDATQFEQAKASPSFQKLFACLQNSKNGFVLTRVAGMTPDGVERAFQEFGDSLPLSFVYGKLFEFNQSPLPLVKINFKYNHKDTNEEISDEVVFRK